MPLILLMISLTNDCRTTQTQHTSSTAASSCVACLVNIAFSHRTFVHSNCSITISFLNGRSANKQLLYLILAHQFIISIKQTAIVPSANYFNVPLFRVKESNRSNAIVRYQNVASQMRKANLFHLSKCLYRCSR